MIIGTFLESYDLSNVDIYPFTQSASMDTEQFNNSVEFVTMQAELMYTMVCLLSLRTQKPSMDIFPITALPTKYYRYIRTGAI